MNELAEALEAARARNAPLSIQSDGHVLHVNFPTVSVRDLRTGALVAHSSMRTDFEASLEEFVSDYLPGVL